MDISVVIPCYNAARFIRACLDSVAAQTLAACEVIVIDDGSSDASREVVDAAPLPVRWLQTERCGGAGARNAGIEAASGEWLAFLDADDIWYPNHLERAAEMIARHEPVGYINHYDRFPAVGEQIEKRRCKFDSVVTGLGLDEYVAFFARYGHFVGMSACLVETRRARAIGGLRVEQKRRHDIEFWLRVVAGEKWLFDPLATSAYRKNSPGGLSADAAEAAYYGFEAFRRHRTEAADLDGFDVVLRERARSAISRSYGSDSDEARERAYSAAFDYLAPRHKLVFGLTRRFPGLFPALRALKLA
jgi:glycosyltransferase involved in cell wall biosynthesis